MTAHRQSGAERSGAEGLRLRLPATSANLGPCFDAAALALALYLEVEAQPAAAFQVKASGRNADICSAVEDNLLIETYRGTIREAGRDVPPLRLVVENGIPLGMGCGSSAAVRLAGVALAAHFGRLGWEGDRILAEACKLEGHPDNAAACWLGGFVVAACEGGRVHAVSLRPPAGWHVLLALPEKPLATVSARAALPASYSRQDVAASLQHAALLTAAFATGRADRIGAAMHDLIHQPYRAEICPLLPLLLPLAGEGPILGAALSGAGPAILLLLDGRDGVPEARKLVERAVAGRHSVELLDCAIEASGVVSEQVTLPVIT